MDANDLISDLRVLESLWVPPASEKDLPGINYGDVLGCGLYGCVFGTEDPKVVIKFTQSVDEAALMDMQSRADWLGFVRVLKVFQIGRSDYLIWRDRLDQCCAPAVQSLLKQHGLKGNRDFDLTPYGKSLQEYIEAIVYNQDLEPILEKMSGIPGMRDIASGLQDTSNESIIIDDVHQNNVGRFNNYDQLIIFDAMPESTSDDDLRNEIEVLE